jgi:hypothetical protein
MSESITCTAEPIMRAVIPIALVFAGLAANDFAYSRLPGGWASADLAEIAFLAQEGAVAGLNHAFPEWRNSSDSRVIHRHRQRHRRSHRQVHRHRYREQSTQTRIIRNGIRVGSERVTVYPGEQTIRLRIDEVERARLRGFGQRGHESETENPVEITFVVPEKSAGSASGTTRRGSSRNR